MAEPIAADSARGLMEWRLSKGADQAELARGVPASILGSRRSG
jgi:hypothetical protein